MTSFTIKDMESLTGIKAHTIRIWEQRYKLLRPKRKDTNHRVYDNRDLKHMMRIAYLYRKGYKISKIAGMTEDEIRELSIEETGHKGGATPQQVYVNQLVEAMIDFDQIRFEKIFHNVLLRMGFEQTILRIVYPFLERTGLLWLVDNVIPAQEHFASHIIRKKLMVAIDGLDNPPDDGRKYVVFLPEGEFHEIPLLFVQYLLKKQGQQVVNFGANVPLEDIRFYAERKKVDYFYTHLITNFPEKTLEKLVRDLGKYFKDTPFAISGPQTERLTGHLPDNVQLLRSLDETLDFARRGEGL
ncbi:MerR family transcriptional regulator [Chitinophaga lutea]